MKNKGIVLDDQNDLQIVDGMLVIGETTAQNKRELLLNHIGTFKLSPTVGIGIEDMLLDEDPLHWRTEVAKGLRADGMKVNSVHISTEEIIIDADYNS